MKTLLKLLLLITVTTRLNAQAPLINFDFNTTGSYPPPAYAEGDSYCILTSNVTYAVGTGTVTSGAAFFSNSTAGSALKLTGNAGALTNCKYYRFGIGAVTTIAQFESYQLYFQAMQTGASYSMTVDYSLDDGTTYINVPGVYTVGGTFQDVTVDLSSIADLNGFPYFLIKLKVYGGGTGGVFLLDNFQVQALTAVDIGPTTDGWVLSTERIATLKNVGIGTYNPSVPLDVVGNAHFSGNLALNNLTSSGSITSSGVITSSGLITGANLTATSLAGAGNRSLFVNSTGGVFAAAALSPSSPNSCIPGAPQWSIGGDNITALSLADRSIGTCDNTDFILKSNNVPSMWIKPNGSIGINNSYTSAKLSIRRTAGDNSRLFDVVSNQGSVFVNADGGLQLSTTSLNIVKPFLITSEDDDTEIISEVFSTGIQGQTKVYCVNTTVAQPAFSVQGIDLTADAQDRVGSIFKIYGNQNGDVSSSVDMSLYYHPGKSFLVYAGAPTDGGLNNIGANATVKFSINGFLTSMTDRVEIGNPNMFGNVSSNSALKINVDASLSKAISIYPKTGTTIAGTESFVVYRDGTVGIGTALANNPYSYKLAVNGTIGCKAFKVEINSSTWSDFVFDKNYKLMPLNDLEQFILKNRHLPNIPSNAEVDANNGVDVVDVESKLLQKVEELTLYIIQQQKEIEELKKSVKK